MSPHEYSRADAPARTAIAWMVGALCLLAFLVRLSSILHPFTSTVTPDWDEFHGLARTVLDEGRYGVPDDWRENPHMADAQWRYAYDGYGTVRAPGYSMLIVLTIVFFGDSMRTVMVVSALLVALTVPFAYLTGRRLGGPWAGVVVAALRAVDPGDTLYLGAAGREPLMGCCITVGIYFIVTAVQDKKLSAAFGAGLCFGLAGYVKETLAPIAVLAGMAMLARGSLARDRGAILAAIPMVLLPVMLLSPWIVRNSLAYGQLTGMTVMDGTNLWLGLVDDSRMDSSVRNDLQLDDYLSTEEGALYNPYTAADPYEANRRLRQATFSYASAHPGQVFGHLLRNGGFFWSPLSRGAIERGPSLRDPELVVAAFYVASYGLALAGIWVMRRRFETHVIWLVLLVISALHMPFSFGARMRLPFNVLVFLLAAPAIVTVWRVKVAPLVYGARRRAESDVPASLAGMR